MLPNKPYEMEYNCPNIKDIAEIAFHCIDDPKKGLKTKGRMEDCDSTEFCLVGDDSVGFDWKQCPIYGKTEAQINAMK